MYSIFKWHQKNSRKASRRAWRAQTRILRAKIFKLLSVGGNLVLTIINNLNLLLKVELYASGNKWSQVWPKVWFWRANFLGLCNAPSTLDPLWNSSNSNCAAYDLKPRMITFLICMVELASQGQEDCAPKFKNFFASVTLLMFFRCSRKFKTKGMC